MKKPETRTVAQCILTPVVTEKMVDDGGPRFESRKPYLKMAMLNTIVSDRKVLAHVLPELERVHPEIVQSLKYVEDGDPLAAAQRLADVDSDAIFRFGEEFVKAESRQLARSVREAETTIVQLGEKSSQPAVPRDALLAGVNEIKLALAKELAVKARESSSKAATQALTHNMAEVFDTVERLVSGTYPEMQRSLSLGEVQKTMTDHAANSAQFLASTGFFAFEKYYPTTMLQYVAHNAYYRDWYEQKLARKKAQLRAMKKMMQVEPIGYLHLEKLDFVPVGYVLGELVYSLPLMPGEVVRLTHREWTRTDSEYEKIVEESIESYTEEALTEKTELAISSEDERKHGLAFNAGVRVSGGYGPVTVSAEVGFSATSSESSTRTFSSKNAREITQKASSRVKKEQKTTFRIATRNEVEDLAFREIKNETADPVRWDFHRLMKRWKVELYRFDVRMTYDIVVPEPASYLMRKFVRLERLKGDLDKAFGLGFTPTSLTRGNWTAYGAQYGVALDAPPQEYRSIVANDFNTFSSRTIGYGQLEVKLPQGYQFSSWNAQGSEFVTSGGGSRAGYLDPLDALNGGRLNAGANRGDSFIWTYLWDWSEPAEPPSGAVLNISVFATGRLTDAAFNEWRAKSYERLVDAARSQYETKRQALQREINQLEQELFRDDALVLRKIEKEEIMKGVLRWVLGPEFSFYPADLPPLGVSEEQDLDIYGTRGNIRSQQDYENLLKHGELVRFLHQAIEWENVIYVLYPYFWTDHTRWELKQSLYHPEFIHRSFLRAGAARVVLTIRPGFEKAFLSFMETLAYGQILHDAHPYMSAASEMKAMAETSYPFTPLANELPRENLIDEWYEFTPTGAMDVRKGTVLDDLNAEPDEDA